MGTLSSFFLGLTLVLIYVTVAISKRCYYCDLTNRRNCVGIPMHCGEEEDCYIGLGTDIGPTMIINKGCVEATHCAREQPISYMGITYSFITYCCPEDLCNSGSPGPNQVPSNLSTMLAGLSLTLLLSWLI